MTSRGEMPAFPDRKAFQGPNYVLAGKPLSDYNRELAAAWEARARLAVEALFIIKGGSHCVGTRLAIEAAEALATIGPLPPEVK